MQVPGLDKAQQLELEVFGRQKFMNAVIDEGNSPIQQLFFGATIFITGGGGFLGKHLIEKLLRACKIKKIYVLMRSKKNKTAQERLDFILQDPVYDMLRGKQPNFENLLEIIEGDISELKLGISAQKYSKIIEEVNFIFHMAATVRFDGPLRLAIITNVRGTRECLSLAKACKQLRFFTHVSTAFSHATDARVGTELKEQFYPCPISPSEIIELAEGVESNKLDENTAQIIKGWPNTYTFSKALAEELIRISAGDLPVCVVRPPVVLSAYYEPCPGWTDLNALYGPCGIFVGLGLGVLHVFPVNTEINLNMVPLDYVTNAIIAVTWDACEKKKNKSREIPICTISSTKRNIDWDFLKSILASNKKHYSPMTVWYCYVLEVTNPILYWFLTWILHYIPGYLADGVCKVLGIKIKGIPSFQKMYENIYKMSNVFYYFFNNYWYFSDDNLTDVICRMSLKDRDIFNCDVYTIDYAQYTYMKWVGLRKYVLKDGLKDSDKAYKRQTWFLLGHIIFMTLYAFVAYLTLYFYYSVIKYIVY